MSRHRWIVLSPTLWRGILAGYYSDPKVTPQKLKAIHALLAQGMPKTEIARQLGIGRTTLYEAIRLL